MKRAKLWKYGFLLCGICIALSACAGAGSTGAKIGGVDVSQEIDEYLNDFVGLYTSNVIEETEPAVIIEERDYPADSDNGALLVEYTDRSGRLLRYELCFYGETGNTVINYYFCEHFIWVHRQKNHYSSAVLDADYPDILYSEDENWILMDEDVYLLHDDKTLEKTDGELPGIPLPEELAAVAGETAGVGERPAKAYGREADLSMMRGEYAMAAETLRDGADVTGDARLADRLGYLRENLVLVKVARYKGRQFLQEMSYRYEYDDLGNETKNLYYSRKGQILSGWEREYDPKGNPVKSVCYDKGEITYWEEYGYDQDQNLLCYARRGEKREKYQEHEYDENGNRTKTREYYYNEDGDLNNWCEYEYDAAGNLAREVRKFEFREGDEIDRYHEEYEYDSAGNTTKHTSYDEDGEIGYREEYERDEAGHTIKYVDYGRDEKILDWVEYEYDEAGHEIKWVRYEGAGRISDWAEWKYNEAGSLMRYFLYSGEKSIAHWREYEYDAQGREVKSVVYNEEGKISCLIENSYGTDRSNSKEIYYDDEGVKYRRESEYDKAGHLVLFAYFDRDSSLRSRWEREYDENGVMRKDIRYNKDENIYFWYEYNEAGHATKELNYKTDGSLEKWCEYQYDQSGNCVHIDSFKEDGVVNHREDKSYDALGNLTRHTIWTPDGETVYTHTNKYRLKGTWQRLWEENEFKTPK